MKAKKRNSIWIVCIAITRQPHKIIFWRPLWAIFFHLLPTKMTIFIYLKCLIIFCSKIKIEVFYLYKISNIYKQCFFSYFFRHHSRFRLICRHPLVYVLYFCILWLILEIFIWLFSLDYFTLFFSFLSYFKFSLIIN